MKGTNHCLFCTWGNIDPYLSCTYEGYQPLFILFMQRIQTYLSCTYEGYQPLFILFMWRIETLIFPILHMWRVWTNIYPIHVEDIDRHFNCTCGGYRLVFIPYIILTAHVEGTDHYFSSHLENRHLFFLYMQSVQTIILTAHVEGTDHYFDCICGGHRPLFIPYMCRIQTLIFLYKFK